jgi:hypothetical protein
MPSIDQAALIVAKDLRALACRIGALEDRLLSDVADDATHMERTFAAMEMGRRIRRIERQPSDYFPRRLILNTSPYSVSGHHWFNITYSWSSESDVEIDGQVLEQFAVKFIRPALHVLGCGSVNAASHGRPRQ